MKYYIGTITKSRNVINRVNLALELDNPYTCSEMYKLETGTQYCTPILDEWVDLLTSTQKSAIVDVEPAIKEDVAGIR